MAMNPEQAWLYSGKGEKLGTINTNLVSKKTNGI
jgi:hypothetical protein